MFKNQIALSLAALLLTTYVGAQVGIQTGQHGLKQIGWIGSDFNFFFESVAVNQNHIGVGAANV